MLKTLLIDNYDSYTHIIYQYLWKLSGEKPLVIKNDQLKIEALARLDFENIVISPGPGTVTSDKDIGICKDIFEYFPNKTILGVCLGHQLLGHHFGSNIMPAPQPMHGKYSKVALKPSPLFANMPAEIEVVRYHSLVIDQPGDQLEVIGRSKDDDQIMAIQHKEKPFFGVQFHPESIGTSWGEMIFHNFLTISSNWTSTGQLQRKRSLRKLSLKAIPWKDPQHIFEHCFHHHPYCFWLDSSLIGTNGRYSFMGASENFVALDQGKIQVNGSIPQPSDPLTGPDTFFDYLKKSSIQEAVASEEDMPFKGGWLGYLAYESHQYFMPYFKSAQLDQLNYPESFFLWVENFIAFDHLTQRLYLCSVSEDEANRAEWVTQIEFELSQIEYRYPSICHPKTKPYKTEPAAFDLQKEKESYLEDIQKIQQLIREGESYEVCLTNEFSILAKLDPFDLYKVLRKTNPAPYSAFIKMPGTAFLSSSPECFFTLNADKKIKSEPIKGTRPIGTTQAETQHIKEELLSNTKDHSELLMITDLIRNDLSKVCKPGSVKVSEMLCLSEYATVLQTSSVIEGSLLAEKTAIDVLKESFPGGSITGAPKLRTMEIIEQFEQRARGLYTGSIGYLSLDQAAEFNIAIRTMVYEEAASKLSFGSGGAILAESDPNAEFEEILVKAFALIRATQQASLVPTKTQTYEFD